MNEIPQLITATGPEAMWSLMVSTLGLGLGLIAIVVAAVAKPRWGIGIGATSLLLGLAGLALAFVAYSNGLEIAERFVANALPDMKEKLLRLGRTDVRKVLWLTAGASSSSIVTGGIALLIGLRRRRE